MRSEKEIRDEIENIKEAMRIEKKLKHRERVRISEYVINELKWVLGEEG